MDTLENVLSSVPARQWEPIEAELKGKSMKDIPSEQYRHGGKKRAINRDVRRRSLVLAAYQLIAEKGFEHLRTRDVAERADVNIATLHYYFASKQDIIPEVVEHLFQEFRAIPIPTDEGEVITALHRVRGMLQAIRTLFEAKPELFIVLSELVLHSLRDDSLRESLVQLDEGWHGYFVYLIQEGIKQGLFRSDLNPASTATSLIILLKGFFFHQITSPRSSTLDQILDDVERLLLP